MAIQVRPARPDDLEQLVGFNAAMALETEGLELDPERLRSGVAAVLAPPETGGPERGSYHVAEADGAVVGALMVTREWSDWRNGWFWWIQSVYVTPEHRRRGVLSALYERVLAQARGTPGVAGVRLYVERSNARARRAYERLGMSTSSYRLLEVDLVLDRPDPASAGG